MIAGWLLLAAWSVAMFALGVAAGAWWIGRQARRWFEKQTAREKDAPQS